MLRHVSWRVERGCGPSLDLAHSRSRPLPAISHSRVHSHQSAGAVSVRGRTCVLVFPPQMPAHLRLANRTRYCSLLRALAGWPPQVAKTKNTCRSRTWLIKSMVELSNGVKSLHTRVAQMPSFIVRIDKRVLYANSIACEHQMPGMATEHS